MLFRLVALASAFVVRTALAATGVSIPSTFNDGNLVFSNFYGISIELSIVNTLIGESTSTVPPQILNYLSNIHSRANRPVRVRVGGNSMDSSVYDPSQSNMITISSPAINEHDQPTTFGPVFFDVLKSIADTVGGMDYIIGLSLILFAQSPQAPLAHDAEQKLGKYLDAMLLGNEPDLYAGHGNRPPSWSQTNYFQEFNNVTQSLNSSSFGNLLEQPLLGGPTICCAWNLIDLLNQGYLGMFGADMKYVNLQHYPQDNCDGTPQFGLDYYTQHSNVVTLGQWQMDGIMAARPSGKPVLLGEFNTASCGGVPGISNTFAAALWQMDYVLQLASVGFSGAFIHTRERGITYNLFDPPAANDSSTGWTTLPSYYSLLPIAEVLSSGSGAFVKDLSLDENENGSSVAGYGVFDASGKPFALALFNYADEGSEPASFTFQHPSGSADSSVYVRYLNAPSLNEGTQISWSGKTLAGRGDAVFVNSNTGADQHVSCVSAGAGGCTVGIPSPGFAVVWFDAANAVSGTFAGVSGTSSTQPPNASPSSGSSGTVSHTGGHSESLRTVSLATSLFIVVMTGTVVSFIFQTVL